MPTDERQLDMILKTIAHWRLQATTGYNDGWTKASYRENLLAISEALPPISELDVRPETKEGDATHNFERIPEEEFNF